MGAGHFSCLGIEAGTPDELGELLARLAGDGRATPAPDGMSMVTWRDPSGARLTFYANGDGELQCVTPSFDARSRTLVRVKRFVEDGDCRYCDRLLVDVLDGGERVYPLAVQIDDIGVMRAHVQPDRPARLALTGFAEADVRVYADEKAHAASQAGDVRFAPESLIPTGLFTPEGDSTPPQAHALISGRVRSSALLTNESTGGEFVHAVVRTFGTELDLVLALEDARAALPEGSIVSGGFWVVGRIVEG